MTVMVRVQHHPSRVVLLDRLLPGLAGLDAEVVCDPDPDGKPSAWRTYRECLARPTDADWLVVVQDDAIPAAGLADALPAILAANVGSLVALFVAGAPVRLARQVERAHHAGRRYVHCGWRDWIPTVALAWPAPLAARMVEWADHHVPADHLADDTHVGRFVRWARIDAVACAPSVFQHPDDEPSLIGRKHRAGSNPFRVAAAFTGTADYDWTAAR